MLTESLLSKAGFLLARVAEDGHLLAYPIEQVVEPTKDVGAHSRDFQARLDESIELLRGGYGPTADPLAAREAGIDPEALLGNPPRSLTESDVTIFAVWRTGTQWLFVAGRHYSKGSVCWSLVLLGAAGSSSPTDGVAMRRPA